MLQTAEPRHVRQFQFHGWPASESLPLRKQSLIELLQLIEKWQQRSGDRTIVVHCMYVAQLVQYYLLSSNFAFEPNSFLLVRN